MDLFSLYRFEWHIHIGCEKGKLEFVAAHPAALRPQRSIRKLFICVFQNTPKIVAPHTENHFLGEVDAQKNSPRAGGFPPSVHSFVCSGVPCALLTSRRRAEPRQDHGRATQKKSHGKSAR